LEALHQGLPPPVSVKKLLVGEDLVSQDVERLCDLDAREMVVFYSKKWDQAHPDGTIKMKAKAYKHELIIERHRRLKHTLAAPDCGTESETYGGAGAVSVSSAQEQQHQTSHNVVTACTADSALENRQDLTL